MYVGYCVERLRRELIGVCAACVVLVVSCSIWDALLSCLSACGCKDYAFHFGVVEQPIDDVRVRENGKDVRQYAASSLRELCGTSDV